MSLEFTDGLLRLGTCGLVVDACGVLLLGAAFFLKDTDAMLQESGATWDSTAYKAVAIGKCDGIFGTTLLFAGFILQALGAYGVSSPSAAVAIYALLVTFLVSYVAFIRKWLSGRWILRIEGKGAGK